MVVKAPNIHQKKTGIGTMCISKGKLRDTKDPDSVVSDITFYSWDAIQECRGEECPADKYCPYERVGKCMTMLKFLKATATSLVFKNPDISQDIVFRVGTELMPLYSQMLRFFIEEIGIKEASYKNRGKLGVHPIFKEIRECIKLIGVTRQKIGINISLETPDPHSVFQGYKPLRTSRKPRDAYE